MAGEDTATAWSSPARYPRAPSTKWRGAYYGATVTLLITTGSTGAAPGIGP